MKKNEKEIHIIGGGLAGCEAALTAAKYGATVVLYEMRPEKTTPAHKTSLLAELICSNSLGSLKTSTGSGLLKEELLILGSSLLKTAHETAVPSGHGLVVDRNLFSKKITDNISNNPDIKLKTTEITDLKKLLKENVILIIASGPLTSEGLLKEFVNLWGEKYLYFYDAISPVIEKYSLNLDQLFFASRYDRGAPTYLNLPLSSEEYLSFRELLLNAEQTEIKFKDEEKFFEACLPIEELAKRGIDTLRYGPMKPVGLINPKTGKEAYAIIQLRPENKEGTCFNIVGFQTRMKYKEQKRVLSTLPGFSNCKFTKYGQMHKNTYINAPEILEATLQLKTNPQIFVAGQLSGTEGYIEAIAGGFLAGINAVKLSKEEPLLKFPLDTAVGVLFHAISTPVNCKGGFQPQNVNFGLFGPMEEKIRNKIKRYEARSAIAIKTIESFKKENIG